jgi:two-component system sensor histidine kinase/response regulator
MKILVIEDQPAIRETLKDLLEINGHEVLAAEDGAVGVKLAEQNPEFIFCDMTMPMLDGLGVLAAIKQMPGVCDVPFVFLTARADRADQRQGMALGADDYITKPFSEADLLNAIAARTKRQGGVREKIAELAGHHRREIHAQWSHELLTPLNAVLGGLDLLESSADTIKPDELKEILAFMREGAERQERLARKLIRYFRLEQVQQAAAPIESARCSVADAIDAAAAKAAEEAKRPEALAIAVGKGEVALRGEWLCDAIYEVVANALAFSPADNRVTVSGGVRAGVYRIEIADQGPGLTAEQRAQVGAFIQFNRQKREQQGLGLGLAIAQMTATMAGGHLTLEPGADGRGLRVIIDLPLAGE